MNDFSLPNAFKAALNSYGKHFFDIFFLTILAAAFILVMSLFWNAVLIYGVDAALAKLISENALQTSSGYFTPVNPFMLLFIYSAAVAATVLLFLFFTASALLPFCKGGDLKLKNFFPGFLPSLKFLFILIAAFSVYSAAVVAVPVLAKNISGGDGYTAGVFAVSVISFAVIAGWTIFIMRYFFVFPFLLEKSGLKDALKCSSLLSKGCRMKIFILLTLIFCINFVGKILLFALLFTLPFSVLTILYAYLDLKNEEPEPQENLSAISDATAETAG